MLRAELRSEGHSGLSPAARVPWAESPAEVLRSELPAGGALGELPPGVPTSEPLAAVVRTEFPGGEVRLGAGVDRGRS